VPKPENSPSAIVVSGGKQYRVGLGDRILVDRLTAEPGSSVKLGRVLMVIDGDGVRVGNPVVEGLDIDAKVLAHRRGPRIETIRYKSKKRVRVHRGGRADLTALEILAIGGVGIETEEAAEEKEETRPKGRGRRKAEPKKAKVGSKVAPKVEAEAETEAAAEVTEQQEEAPKKTSRRRTSKKEEE
jgi:large subunit ribosomal protein L21